MINRKKIGLMALSIWLVSLILLVYAQHTRFNKDILIDGEEMAVGVRNVEYFKYGEIADGGATNYTTTLTLVLLDPLVPTTLTSSRWILLALASFAAPLAFLFLIKFFSDSRLLTVYLMSLCFGLVPHMNWLSIFGIEAGYSLTLSFLTLAYYVYLPPIENGILKFKNTIGMLLLMLLSIHVYGAYISYVATVFAFLFFDIIRQKPLTKKVKLLVTVILILVPFRLFMFWPSLFIKNPEYTGTGSRISFEHEYIRESILQLYDDFFRYGASYSIVPYVVTPVFNMLYGGIAVLGIAALYWLYNFQSRQLYFLTLLFGLNLASCLFISGPPGLRRGSFVILMIYWCYFLGVEHFVKKLKKQWLLTPLLILSATPLAANYYFYIKGLKEVFRGSLQREFAEYEAIEENKPQAYSAILYRDAEKLSQMDIEYNQTKFSNEYAILVKRLCRSHYKTCHSIRMTDVDLQPGIKSFLENKIEQ